MNFLGKVKSESGITVIALIFILLIIIVVTTLSIKSISGSQSIGATDTNKEMIGLIRKIC